MRAAIDAETVFSGLSGRAASGQSGRAVQSFRQNDRDQDGPDPHQ
jgi:hypothetical protein